MSADMLPAQDTCAVRFMLDVDPEPGMLARLLMPFAKRDLVPDRMWSHRARSTMHVEIALDLMPVECVALVEGNLRQIVGVRCLTRHEPAMVRRAA